MSDRTDSNAPTPEPNPPPTEAQDNRLAEEEIRDSSVDFDFTVLPNPTGKGPQRVHKMSDPISGGSVISWAELLRQQQMQRSSDAEVALGSLPDLQIDAVSDKDLVKNLDSGTRVGQGAPAMPPPAPVNPISRRVVPPAAAPDVPTTPESLAARLFTHENPRHDDWVVEAPPDANNPSSSVDLSTAASLSDSAMKGDSKKKKPDDSDVLANALIADDGSSTVNLGMEPRVMSVLSNIAKPPAQAPMAAAAVPAPPRKVKSQPSMLLAKPMSQWLGGGAMGVALTGLAVFLWYGGKFPARKPVVQVVQPLKTVAVADNPAPTPEAGRKHLEAGDPATALAVLKDCPETPEVFLGRGQARWLEYARQQRQKKAPLGENDADVAAARQDLVQSKLPEGILWIGLMNEALGHLDAARDTYKNGATTFPDKAKLFQAATARLDVMAGRKPRFAAVDPKIGLALSLFLTQPGATEPDEAGFDYWDAVKRAKERDFSGAREALLRARAAHEERRATVLRQGLNPNSDPREDIFLHNCDQLLTYWDTQVSLQTAGLKFDPENPSAVLATIGNSQKKLEQALRTVADRLSVEKTDDVPAALDLLIAQRKKAEDEYRQAEKQLRMATTSLSAANASIETLKKDATEQAKAALAKLQEATGREAAARKALADFTAARKEADDTLKVLSERLKAAKLIGDNPKPQEFVSAFDTLMKPAGTAPVPTIDVAAFKGEIERLKEALARTRSPAQMLDLWPAMLESSAAREALPSAFADADAATTGPTADARTKAKAAAVRGFALMAKADYAQARAAFEQVRRGGELAGDPAWAERLRKAETELNDSRATQADARRFLDHGDPAAALAQAERGLRIFSKDSFPNDFARLVAMRGEALVKLDRLDDAERDATAAVEGGAATAGFYTAGRVAEKRGRWDAAKDAYRKAYSAGPQGAELNTIRVALARVLARPEADAADLGQAEKLADEAIQAGQAEGHLVKARVLYRHKKHTEALQQAMRGLSGIAPPEFGEGWDALVATHPAFTGSASPPPAVTVVEKPDPAIAERFFAVGLRHYYDRDYAAAESDFATALKNNGRDARFLYFLGLARLPLGKIELAQDDFRRAAVLERQGHPDSRTIGMYFERVQGEERRIINQFRK